MGQQSERRSKKCCQPPAEGGEAVQQQQRPRVSNSGVLCFRSSVEGTLWASRYIFFPFLIAIEFGSLGTAWRYCYLPWRAFESTPLLLGVAFVHMFAIGALYLLFKTRLTPAGHVPLDWEPPSELLETGSYAEPENRGVSTPTWCSKCQSHRPARSHHCRFCQRCILAFDHHCPWVSNCVGWGNMKYFMLMLFWASAYGAAIVLSFTVRCYQVVWLEWDTSETVDKAVLVGLLMFWSSFAFGVMGLAQAMLVQLLYLTPSCERVHLAKRIRQIIRQAPRERIGFMRSNIELVFGPRMPMWYVPSPPHSDPFNYPSFADRAGPSGDDINQKEERERIESLNQLREQRGQSANDDGSAPLMKAKEVAADDSDQEHSSINNSTSLIDQDSRFDPALFYGNANSINRHGKGG